jgi:hypothetical protein
MKCPDCKQEELSTPDIKNKPLKITAAILDIQTAH